VPCATLAQLGVLTPDTRSGPVGRLVQPLLEIPNLGIASRKQALQLLDRRRLVRDLSLKSLGDHHDTCRNVPYSNSRIMRGRLEWVVSRHTPNLNLQVVLVDHARSVARLSFTARSGVCESRVVAKPSITPPGQIRAPA
jgi:hypothetical protein